MFFHWKDHLCCLQNGHRHLALGATTTFWTFFAFPDAVLLFNLWLMLKHNMNCQRRKFLAEKSMQKRQACE